MSARQTVHDLNPADLLRVLGIAVPAHLAAAAAATPAIGAALAELAAAVRDNRPTSAQKASAKAERKLEGEIEDSIVTWLEQHSPLAGLCVVYRQRRDRATTGLLGWPDLEILHDGRSIFFEVKTPTGRCSTDQLKMHQRLARVGHPVAVVRSLDEAMQVVKSATSAAVAQLAEVER